MIMSEMQSDTAERPGWPGSTGHWTKVHVEAVTFVSVIELCVLLVVAWAFFGCGWIRTSLLLQASHIFNVTANSDRTVEFRRALQNRVHNALRGVCNAADSLVNLT